MRFLSPPTSFLTKKRISVGSQWSYQCTIQYWILAFSFPGKGVTGKETSTPGTARRSCPSNQQWYPDTHAVPWCMLLAWRKAPQWMQRAGSILEVADTLGVFSETCSITSQVWGTGHGTSMQQNTNTISLRWLSMMKPAYEKFSLWQTGRRSRRYETAFLLARASWDRETQTLSRKAVQCFKWKKSLQKERVDQVFVAHAPSYWSNHGKSLKPSKHHATCTNTAIARWSFLARRKPLNSSPLTAAAVFSWAARGTDAKWIYEHILPKPAWILGSWTGLPGASARCTPTSSKHAGGS